MKGESFRGDMTFLNALREVLGLAPLLDVGQGRRGRQATCCPDEPHRANGLCIRCYHKQRRAA
jgi:hypothetical protein